MKSKQKGGSPASDNVMSLMEKTGNITNNYPEPYVNVLTKTDVLKNYGSVYKTTGGGNVVGINKNQIKNFVKRIGNNRVFDMYLKYMGIKTLTSATLVPLALIMGKNTFAKIVSDFVSQKGGFLKNKIPFIDDPLLGAYLKISGLTTLTLAPSTLVPLGIIMAVYEIYENNQSGGRVLMPARYFNKNKMETYVVTPPKGNLYETGPSALESSSVPLANVESNIQTGGRYVGSSVPPNIAQNVKTIVSGSPLTHNLQRHLSYVNNNLQKSGVPNFSGGVPEPIESIQSETVGIGDVTPETNSSTLGTDVNSANWGARQGYKSIGNPSVSSGSSQHIGGRRKNRKNRKNRKQCKNSDENEHGMF